MAKSTFFASAPYDTPILIRPGVMHREASMHGNGHWYSLPPEHPERRAKGDLGSQHIPDFEPRPLTHSGSPFANLRNSK
jgi:hypothetical protein